MFLHTFGHERPHKFHSVVYMYTSTVVAMLFELCELNLSDIRGQVAQHRSFDIALSTDILPKIREKEPSSYP